MQGTDSRGPHGLVLVFEIHDQSILLIKDKKRIKNFLYKAAWSAFIFHSLQIDHCLIRPSWSIGSSYLCLFSMDPWCNWWPIIYMYISVSGSSTLCSIHLHSIDHASFISSCFYWVNLHLFDCHLLSLIWWKPWTVRDNGVVSTCTDQIVYPGPRYKLLCNGVYICIQWVQ